MSVTEIINTVVAGGLLGALGQGIRAAVGLKKLNDSNISKTIQNKDVEPFSASRLLISIFIGFVAGSVALFIRGFNVHDYSKETIVAIMAAGYSGADFIEGFFNTYISRTTAATPGKGAAGNQVLSNSQALQQPLLVNDESPFNNNRVLG